MDTSANSTINPLTLESLSSAYQQLPNQFNNAQAQISRLTNELTPQEMSWQPHNPRSFGAYYVLLHYLSRRNLCHSKARAQLPVGSQTFLTKLETNMILER